MPTASPLATSIPKLPSQWSSTTNLFGGQLENQNYAQEKTDYDNFMSSPDLTRFGDSPFSASIKPISYTGGSYQAKDMSNAALPQYDAMRARIDKQYNQQQQQGQESIDRQFAAAGGGPGKGAQLKQTENLAGQIASQKGNDLESLNTQELADRFNLQQTENQKEFQSGESARGYNFQASEFNAGQNATIANLNMAWENAQQESVNNVFNRELAKYQQEHSGGLLGGGGFLGTGIGA